MLKKWIWSAVVVVTAGLLPAAELPATVKFSNNGSFRIGDAEFYIQNYSSSWVPLQNGSWQNRKAKLGTNGLTLSAVMPVGGQKADVSETIIPTGEAEFRLDFQAKFRELTLVNALHGVFQLPAGKMTVFVDGKAVQLPGRYSTMTLLSRSKAKEFRFPVAGGYEVLVTGNPLRLTIQDNRKFENDTFAFRFGASPRSGKLRESKLSLSFRIVPVAIQPVSLKKAANMNLADEIAGDGKGGWTDQGPENDLRKLKPGTVRTGALSFEVLDPAKNGGRAALVLAGKQRGFAAPVATLELPENRAGAVNLLHASAWTPANGKMLGTLVAQYADGSSVRIPVVAGRDCGNWWNPFRGKNAAIVWSAENPEALVGLYASSFALPKPGPKLLRFEAATPETVWMIAGVTLSDRPVHFGAVSDKPVEMEENYEWKPLAFKRTINRGSALDFSFLADAPAGKYGFIRPTPQGTLTFEKAPQKRIRLYGPNLCFSASFLTKAAVDQLADYFVYCGYNTVRIHRGQHRPAAAGHAAAGH